MPSTRSRPAPFVVRLSVSIVVLSCALAALPSAASAGTPAAVTVTVQGFNGQTLLAPTVVTTNTTPINVDGNSADDCSGTSAGGALYDAVHGDWGVSYDSGLGVSINAIDGLDLGSTSDAYWAFYYDGSYASLGACSQELTSGDQVAFAASCYQTGPDCLTTLTETAPSASTVGVGSPVTVTVGSTAAWSPGSSPALPTDAIVSAGGQSAVVGANGEATLTFSSPGTYTLQATAPDPGWRASNTETVCVHSGNDGTCGTSKPAVTQTTTTTTTSTPAPAASVGVQGATTLVEPKGPDAIWATVENVINSHVYSGVRAPRTLDWKVSLTGTLSAVRLRLTRNDAGRCSYYDGTSERFRASGCGADRAPYFDVGTSPTLDYLLPTRLGPGRYVLDVEGVDTTGRASALYHGTSRIVFYVR